MHVCRTTICNSFLGVVYRKVGSNSLHKKERCVYMCNHRSWADFFVDTYLTEGGAAPMARMMVYAAFPSFMTRCGDTGWHATLHFTEACCCEPNRCRTLDRGCCTFLRSCGTDAILSVCLHELKGALGEVSCHVE